MTEQPRESEFESLLEEYPVRLRNFEGPLDLLLHLIKKNEVNIYDIPIALITQQYLEYLELMQDLNLDVAGEFLVMAATLIHIKSRMLIPRPTPDIEGEEPEEDPREALVRRLLEHQKFKAAAELLHERQTLRAAGELLGEGTGQAHGQADRQGFWRAGCARGSIASSLQRSPGRGVRARQ